jgi:nitrite reductase/ring-hydroxylating ferredoxin subunit
MQTVTVCRYDELPDGAIRRIVVDRRPVAVMRCGDRVYACLDRCPHKGGYFSDGFISVARREVTCPWHRFRFDLESGASVTNPELIVQTFLVRVDDGQILIDFP